MVEQNFSGYNNAFKFNGKEQDPETGMYYYGARYYDPKMSLFISVDPLAEQFQGWSPYNYTMNNPLNLTDPTGMAPEDWYMDASTGKILGKDGAETNNLRLIYRSDWEDTIETHGGSMSASATADLQSRSGLVTVDNLTISSNVQNINTQTINDQSRERQVLIGVLVDNSGDYPSGVLTSVIGTSGPVGEGSVETGIINRYRDQAQTQLYSSQFEGTNLLPVAQAHTHNKVTRKGYKNDPTMSKQDRTSSMSDGLIRYAIDSWTGKTQSGNAIHRVTPKGNITNNVGNTQNFNVGQDVYKSLINK